MKLSVIGRVVVHQQPFIIDPQALKYSSIRQVGPRFPGRLVPIGILSSFHPSSDFLHDWVGSLYLQEAHSHCFLQSSCRSHSSSSSWSSGLSGKFTIRKNTSAF